MQHLRKLAEHITNIIGTQDFDDFNKNEFEDYISGELEPTEENREKIIDRVQEMFLAGQAEKIIEEMIAENNV